MRYFFEDGRETEWLNELSTFVKQIPRAFLFFSTLVVKAKQV